MYKSREKHGQENTHPDRQISYSPELEFEDLCFDHHLDSNLQHSDPFFEMGLQINKKEKNDSQTDLAIVEELNLNQLNDSDNFLKPQPALSPLESKFIGIFIGQCSDQLFPFNFDNGNQIKANISQKSEKKALQKKQAKESINKQQKNRENIRKNVRFDKFSKIFLSFTKSQQIPTIKLRPWLFYKYQRDLKFVYSAFALLIEHGKAAEFMIFFNQKEKEIDDPDLLDALQLFKEVCSQMILGEFEEAMEKGIRKVQPRKQCKETLQELFPEVIQCQATVTEK